MQPHSTAKHPADDAPDATPSSDGAPSAIVPAERGAERDALSDDDRRLLTPAVIERWTRDLAPDDWTPAEVARMERRRLAALKTMRSGALLSDQEWRLFHFLRKNEGRNCTYLMIARHLWQTPSNPISARALRAYSEGGYYRAASLVGSIQVMIHQIRRKLEIDPLRPMHIATIRGVGYRYYSLPPALDDGENYDKRQTEIERDRIMIQRELGIYEGEVVVAVDRDGRPYDTRLTLGAEHPERRSLEGGD